MSTTQKAIIEILKAQTVATSFEVLNDELAERDDFCGEWVDATHPDFAALVNGSHIFMHSKKYFSLRSEPVVAAPIKPVAKPYTITVTYYECEHRGDMAEYESQIARLGGKVISTNPDFDNESCDFTVEVPSKDVATKIHADARGN